MGWLLDLIIFLVVAAIVLMVVDRMNLGISVGGFLNAMIAAAAIAVTSAIVLWLLGLLGISIGGGFLGLMVGILVAALILWLAAKFIPGYSTDGYTGAIIGAIAIGVLYWLINWLLGLFGISVDSLVDIGVISDLSRLL